MLHHFRVTLSWEFELKKNVIFFLFHKNEKLNPIIVDKMSICVSVYQSRTRKLNKIHKNLQIICTHFQENQKPY